MHSDTRISKRSRPFRTTGVLWLSIVFCLFGWFTAFANSSELRKLSLEELMDLEVIPVVTSVSRRPEKVSQTPAAVFVITSEDIRRSGATSIPELLRLAPGLNVSRIDASKWAISARGFNSRFSGNLLVLIDGRSVYTPLYSGVYWDVQDTLLEDIERIEVVRGPGGTTWGANAVNGVINIVTRSAKATEKGLLSLGTGTYEKSEFAYRYGGKLDGNGSFRFFIKSFDQKPFRTSGSDNRADDYSQSRFGFRFDWDQKKNRKMTLDGSLYGGFSHEALILRSIQGPNSPSSQTNSSVVSGGDIRFQLLEEIRPGEDFRLQLYFDRARRIDGTHGDAFDTIDLDMQHHFAPVRNHDVVWGLGYRHLQYSLQDGPSIVFRPQEDTTAVQSFFVQDQIALQPRRLFLTLGTKIYHHPYVGTEGQPSVRLLWNPTERHVLWSAWSEARRIPSISERAGSFIGQFHDRNNPNPEVVQIIGNQSLASEIMKAKEIGYRYLPSPRFSLDLAYFRQDYSRLAKATARTPQPPGPAPVQSYGADNSGIQRIHGVELSWQWKPRSTFRLVGGHTANWQISGDEEDSHDLRPRQWFLRTSWNLRSNLELDLSFQHADAGQSERSEQRLPRIDDLEARIGWRPNPTFELSLGGGYLLQPWHKEYQPQFDYLPSDIPRTYYLKASWQF